MYFHTGCVMLMQVMQWTEALRFTSVKETLGHANIATTGRYLHARPTDSSSLYLES